MVVMATFWSRAGLNKYEEAVLLVLFSNSQMRARDISVASGVPYGRIYDTLYSLISRRLVSVIHTRPKVYTAIEPEAALSVLLESKRSEINALKREWQSVKTQLKRSAPKELKEKVLIFYGTDAALRLGRVGIEQTKHEMLISTTRLEDPAAQELIAKKLHAGVQVRILVPEVTQKNRRNITKIKKAGGKIRIGGQKGLKLGITDERATLITVANPRNPKGFISIIIEGKAFAKAIKEYFKSYWEKAKHI
ncbi:MAG: TrmB family transcriptional regulator [Candidatus Aenigmatarchaeota archaeon]